MLRKPIVTVVGHVDHGKTSFLDTIRQSTVTEGEAGKITQAIGASIVPTETIKRVCGPLIKNMQLRIPGLLFIDTPGHAAFSTLRKRGGALADIAILVVDINEGFMPQTEEAIEILKAAKTPFIVVANKIDLISGWKTHDSFLLQNIQSQSPDVQRIIDERVYELVGQFYDKFQVQAERFDRVQDYTKQIAIVPISAHTKEGLPEVLMALVGLVQKYLEAGLEIDDTGMAKGTILEVKEQKGLGKVLDVILYNGTLKAGDTIVIGGLNGPIITKVRGLFEPAAHAEMMEKKVNYSSTKQVVAATGVRVFAPGVDDVIAGMPIASADPKDTAAAEEEVQAQIDEVLIETDEEGIVVKADTIGSLEALCTLLREKDIAIRKASIGQITKKDLVDAESNYEKDPLLSVILGFNIEGEAATDKVHIIKSNIIYKVIEEFELWQESMKRKEEEEQLGKITTPCKIEIMKGYVFRQSNPAIAGVHIEAGKLRTGMRFMKNDGKEVTTVKAIQIEQKNASVAEQGKEVAAEMTDVTIGRQVDEGTVLYSAINEEEFITLKKLKHLLSKAEIDILKEIATIRRENNPVWGI